MARPMELRKAELSAKAMLRIARGGTIAAGTTAAFISGLSTRIQVWDGATFHVSLPSL
jgi:hypothetical protein